MTITTASLTTRLLLTPTPIPTPTPTLTTTEATMAKEPKNAPPENAVSAANVPPEGWDKAQTSFPPYWEPKDNVVDPKSNDGWVNARFLGTDDSDPEFERHVFQALHDINCKQGSKKGKTVVDVPVHKGDLFTVSVYATFRISRFVNDEIWFRCIGEKPANTPSGFVWDFDVRVPPGKAALLARSEEKQIASGS